MPTHNTNKGGKLYNGGVIPGFPSRHPNLKGANALGFSQLKR
jgi:hypothetical protein